MRAQLTRLLLPLLSLVTACGSASGPALLSPSDAGGPFSDAGGLSAISLDAGAGADAPPLEDDAATDAATEDSSTTTDAGASADAAPDPCVALNATIAHCTALVGTTSIAGADVLTCIDAMPALRATPACTTEAQRSSFDSIVSAVVTSALSLGQATCDLSSLQPRLQWMDRYVRTVRALTDPTETIDHPRLTALDDAFWGGVYWGDARATAFNRPTLRTMRPDALDCAHAVFDAALTPVASTSAVPMTTAPLASILAETLSAFGAGYDRATVAHEFACSFTPCVSADLPAAPATWPAVAALDDAAALRAALGGDAGAPVWASSISQFAAKHALFEGAVDDALGAATYSPSLLSSPAAVDLPALTTFVATISNARILVSSYAADGRYVAGPANDLYGYAGLPDYASTADTDLFAQSTALGAALTTLSTDESAFTAGSQTSYDVTATEAAERSALQWTAARIPPLVALRLPGVLGRIASSPANMISLALLPDAPASFQDVSGELLALQGVVTAFGMENLDTPGPLRSNVAVSFPNPSHVMQPGEPAVPWTQVDATRAKAVWDAISAGTSATVMLQPSDVYSFDGGNAVLVCTQGATVLRGMGWMVEYPPSATMPPSPGLQIPFQTTAAQPYLTASAQLEAFTTTDFGTQAGALPVMFESDTIGWPTGSTIVTSGAADGASPFAPFVVDFTALKTALGSATGAPRSLTLMMSIDVAPITGSMSWVSTCN